MASGGPGDNPIKDVVLFKWKVYNTICDELMRELSNYITWKQIEDRTMGVNNLPTNPELLKKMEERLNNLIKEEKNKIK